MSEQQIHLLNRNGALVCIDGNNDGNDYGRIFIKQDEKPDKFNSLYEMLLKLAELFKDIDIPDNGTDMQAFGYPGIPYIEQKHEKIGDVKNPGKYGSYIICVNQKQNNNWQGHITWIEKNTSICFRSIWELTKVMRSAISLH